MPGAGGDDREQGGGGEGHAGRVADAPRPGDRMSQERVSEQSSSGVPGRKVAQLRARQTSSS